MEDVGFVSLPSFLFLKVESLVVKKCFTVSVSEFAITVLSVSTDKDECKDDYGQMGISDKPADG